MSLLIRGGTVVDGTGGPASAGDVAVENDTVVAVGPSAANALAGVADVEEVDAEGMVVSPGFIDIHTHYDAQVFWDNTLSCSSSHGVTTVVGGNCGFSIAPVSPDNRELLVGMLHDLEDMSAETLRAGIDWSFSSFGEYLNAVDKRRPWLNWAGFVGHSAMRVEAMGPAAFERAATPDESKHMAALAHAALAEGAIGIATSAAPTGRNCPTKFAGLEEVRTIFDELRRARRGVGSFVPGREIDLATLHELQMSIGRPVTWTALLAMNDGQHRERAAIHRLGRMAGADVHPQVSCRRLVFQVRLDSGFALRAPSVLALDRASLAERMQAYRDPAWRDTCWAELETIFNPPNWSRWRIAESSKHAELIGRVVGELAPERGVRELDLVLDTALDDELMTRFEITAANDDEEEVASLLRLEGAVLGLSDAGAHPEQICDAVLPTDLLGGWVRERGVLSLELAIRKLTGEAADLLGLTKRGYLRPGMRADLVVFDPGTIGPGPVRRVRDFPADGERLVAVSPDGISDVFVNGSALTRNFESRLAPGAPGAGQVIRGHDSAEVRG